MPIDYSKWDKIELSDDSDIEVHPNVDKASFIRWKQQDIHEKRHQRNIEIKSILIQLTMYAKLNERVDYLLNNLTANELLDSKIVLNKLNEQFDKFEKFNYEKLKNEKGDSLRKGLKDLQFDSEEVENTPCYNEMIEDLFIQIKDDHPQAKSDGNKLIEYLREHRNKIDDVLSKQTIKLDELLYQKSMLISSEDIHTGFDRSFLNKKDDIEEQPPVPVAPPSTSTKKTVTTTETINAPSTTTPQKPKSDQEMLEELELLPATETFSKIPYTEITESADYLIKHPYICTEQQKDALIMTAFDAQLESNSSLCKQIIHQSLLLQYISQLAGAEHPTTDQTIRAVKLFCSKVAEMGSPARQGFLQDVENTFKHIESRCQVIIAEQAANAQEEGNGQEELIQLRALDENTQLSVNIPKEGTTEYEIFKTKLPKEFQEAVKSQSLDEVNKQFAKLKVEDAEQILEVFNECGVIGISGYLEDEQLKLLNFFLILSLVVLVVVPDQSQVQEQQQQESQIPSTDIVD
ncbi:CDC37 [[Candida] subhashii]|uniref:Hsp90 chaperone protein kinase-targeting subunit n=1 Tax=[Candida] subhashii TaxID=561895 RepID=A0A8J5QPP2_9ASCO|nr:CDC37 [[Candida] subhashii]KAG7664275.1 CDC37 [[Candida] subhashii]